MSVKRFLDASIELTLLTRRTGSKHKLRVHKEKGKQDNLWIVVTHPDGTSEETGPYIYHEIIPELSARLDALGPEL